MRHPQKRGARGMDTSCRLGLPGARRRAAFSLLEVMIAMAILLIVSLSFTTGVIFNARTGVRNKSELFALELINRTIEEMRNPAIYEQLGTSVGAAAVYLNPRTFPYDPAEPADTVNYTVTCRFSGFGTVASASGSTLRANLIGNNAWETNEWQGRLVMVKRGTGGGQVASITANDGNTLTISRNLDGTSGSGWYKNPVAGDYFEIDNGKTVEIIIDWTERGTAYQLTRTALIPTP